MEFFLVIVLSAALSIDGFGVGLAYGIRKIRVTLLPLFLIAACAAPAMSCSLFAGQLVANFLPSYLAGVISGTILFLIGFWQFVEGLKKYKNSPVLLTICLKRFGLVLQVIREPCFADVDPSGDIDYREALLLGIPYRRDGGGLWSRHGGVLGPAYRHCHDGPAARPDPGAVHQLKIRQRLPGAKKPSAAGSHADTAGSCQHRCLAC